MGRKKKVEKKLQIEVIGIIYILIAIIGLGNPHFGPVGNLIDAISALLVGKLHQLLLLCIFIIGTYIIFKKRKPHYFTTKLIGLYLLVIGVLVLLELNYLKALDLKGMDVIFDSFNKLIPSISDISKITGGGVLGASVITLLHALFDTAGALVITWIFIILGFFLFTGFTLSGIIQNFKESRSTKVNKERKQEIKKVIDEVEKKYEEDTKLVVSSVEELVKINEPKHEEIKETKEEVQVEIKDNDYMENKGYRFPPFSLLSKPIKGKRTTDHNFIRDNINVLEQVFTDFGIVGKVVAVNPGPSVTQYEVEIKAGTKVNKILSINRELSLALAAKDVRIQAPIPGKKTIGIEIANKDTSMVTVREILEMIPKNLTDSKLLVTLGKDIMGQPIFCEINKTPHLLVAGATGSGKSVCINSIIISILMRAKPDEVRMILVDPKKVELSMYNGVPHLMAPVVTDPKKANIALKKLVVEMERRYELFSASGTKSIAGYNAYIEKKNETLSEEEQLKKLPFIVAIIDELADLMLVAAKEVEDSILRITQMARAAGIHLIVATQRPSTDVITGLIKANIPSRIAFAVSSSIDSRTILDSTGAEKLLGKGDMLFLPMGENIPLRVQGTYISEDEIKAVVDHTISEQKAKYDETLLMDEEEMHATSMFDDGDAMDEPLYNEIVEFVVTQGKASASLLQRRFRLGYNRAARAIDLLEDRGIIGPNNGSKPREVLVRLEEKE